MSVVVVTGASAGLGRAIAIELARRGDSVGLLARGREGLAGAARDVEAAGGRPFVVPVDVADHDAVEAAAAAVEDALGPIDLWVNNAMAAVFARFLDVPPAEFVRATEVTYLGSVYGTYAALRRMTARDRGHVIQIGSALAYRGIPLQSAYCGAKHALNGFLDSVRTELLDAGSSVRISRIHMPALDTTQFRLGHSHMDFEAQPVPPIYTPELGARSVRWLAEHPRREMWVGETTAATILANRLAPGLLDRYLARTGAKSQLTAQPRAERESYLWAPVPGDHGVHGDFGDRAYGRSLQVSVAKHRRLVAAAGALAGAALARARRR